MRSSRLRPLFGLRTRPEAAALVRFVDAFRERFGVEGICRTLTWAGTPASASTYYAAKAPASLRTVGA